MTFPIFGSGRAPAVLELCLDVARNLIPLNRAATDSTNCWGSTTSPPKRGSCVAGIARLTAGSPASGSRTWSPVPPPALAYRWADAKTLLDIGFAVVRAVELALPFA
jgi:hypothetical protein